MGKLREYRRKREFERTPEPSGETAEDESAQARFVIQEHHARRLHWDFRLERDGVLVSWALPKGVPEDPKRNNLAVHVEDHPLDYIDFAGEIPRGEYGAGSVTVWDHGTYETHKFELEGRKPEVMVTLHGQRVEGRYVLFHT
ncbi:MAG: ATP-dependent DNA ligase, partial [Candidatus Dormibacteraeota bacterium]|nr:ATP-dependent DNA ligase [Candidatus Dormibacteraeota bacterium]